MALSSVAPRSRAERLFRLYLALADGEGLTAEELAAQIDASRRTVFRDLATLAEAGLPLSGQPGVGVRLRESPELPPLLLDAGQMRAVVAGAYAVKAGEDAALARAAESLLERIRALVPPRSRGKYGLR